MKKTNAMRMHMGAFISRLFATCGMSKHENDQSHSQIHTEYIE